ncbi:MAG: DUF1788 domain-containing protein [Deltaproteobacteria bacterium]|nr:DUF1788 domain-containing protein [Deltaproteobacteria bacterium]
MGRIESLVTRYRSHIEAPWQRNLSGDQKAIFVVYPKTDERKLRARLDLFAMATTAAGHRWQLLDLTDNFASWMADTNYRDVYFEEPETLEMKLRSEFLKFTASRLREALTGRVVDQDTVVAVQGVACLFGFTRVSLVLKEVVNEIRGRLLVFFPGEYEDNNYRLLDARDGWNYLAVPITLHNGVND